MPAFTFTIIETTTRTVRIKVYAGQETTAKSTATVGPIDSRISKESVVVLSDETTVKESVSMH